MPGGKKTGVFSEEGDFYFGTQAFTSESRTSSSW